MSIFDSIQINKPKRNHFDLSKGHKTTFQMGELVPTLVQEIVPGDTFTVKTAQLARLAPQIAPVMHNVDVIHETFFVPYRLLYKNKEGWENYITGGKDGTTNYIRPYMTLNNIMVSSIANQLGIPYQEAGNEFRASAFPLAAYCLIWDQYYRDQNLQDEIFPGLEEGENDPTTWGPDGIQPGVNRPLRRAWNHDYFTAALPWAQKGAEATIPIQGDADLVFMSTGGSPSAQTLLRNGATGDVNTREGDLIAANGSTAGLSIDSPGGVFPLGIDVTGNTKVDMSSATATTINELRRAFRLQEWLEKNARGGTRLVEFIKSHFGVSNGDGRMQRAEYCGGGKTPIAFSEVLQTSESTNESPQGNMSGHGINTGQTNGFTKSFTEHGILMVLTSVRPKSAYMQGLSRLWTKTTRTQEYFPSFANLGEQEIKNKEIYLKKQAIDEDTFGYIPRYAEHKYNPDTVAGEFINSLEFWHLARKFEDTPALNETFIRCIPSKRIFAVEDQGQDEVWMQLYHKIDAKRPMPKFGTPMI